VAADLLGCRKRARDLHDVNEREVRDLPWGEYRTTVVVEIFRVRPSPLYVPEVYALHHPLVDVEGYVSAHGHHYSVPYVLIGRQLEVLETKDRIDLYHGPWFVAHPKALGRTFTHVTVPEHRPPRPCQHPAVTGGTDARPGRRSGSPRSGEEKTKNSHYKDRALFYWPKQEGHFSPKSLK
jgi:hypothetical protein